MSYSIENLRLILKIASLAERDLRSDLDSDETVRLLWPSEHYLQTSSLLGATYISDAFREVTRLKNATQKLIEEKEQSA
jgi:hypothetical protein